MVNVNLKQLAQQLLPTFLRQPLRTEWLNALLEPSARLWDAYSQWRKDKIYEAHLTPQTISIEAYLNRRFANGNSLIKILHGEEDLTFVSLKSDGYDLYVTAYLEKENYVYDDDESKPFFKLAGEQVEEVKVGFKVVIPSSINKGEVAGVVEMLKAADIPYEVEVK